MKIFRFNKIALNAVWMMSEKIISIFGLIFVTSSVAKYVGPNLFGQIALSLSIFQIVQIIAHMGGGTIIFKRLSKNLNSGVLLLNATLYMRVLLYFVISIPVLVYYSYKSDYLSSIFIFATFISCFFSTLDVLAIYYDATLNSKINTCINVIGLFISLLLRWFIVLLDWEPVYLSIPIILTGFIPFVIRICIFSSIKKRVVFSKRKKIQYVKYLFKSGYNFVISDISVALYTRLSFFIISFFASKTEVGIYSVALALGNSWGFVNSSIISSFFTKIYSLKNEADSLIISAKLNLLIFVIGLIITIGTLIFAPYFLLWFYGPLYSDAYIPLVILCMSTTVAGLGGVATRYIVRHSGYSFLSKKMFFTLITSVLLSVPLVYFYGIVGAAIATFLTEFISLTLYNYFFKNRVIFDLHKSSVLFFLKVRT